MIKTVLNKAQILQLKDKECVCSCAEEAGSDEVSPCVHYFQFNLRKSTFNIVLIEFVALLHSAKPSILSDCPRSVGVHGRIGPPGVWEHSWQFIWPARWVWLCVHWLYIDSLRCAPDQILGVLSLQLFLSQACPFRVQIGLVLTWYGRVDQTAACLCCRNRSSNQTPDSHRCTRLLCSQHAYSPLSPMHMDHLRSTKRTYVK